MSLGKHLTVATRDKIRRGDYVDVFFFGDLEKKDKGELDERLKERIKCRTIDRTYANWYLGFLIYAGVIVHYQPCWALKMHRYLDIIYKTFIDLPSPAWLQYDEQFRVQVTMNPRLQ